MKIQRSSLIFVFRNPHVMEMISATTPVISTLSVSCYVCGCAHGNVYFTFGSDEGLFILERKQLIMQDSVFEN